MKLHLNSLSGRYAISGYGPGFVLVNGRRIETSLLLLPDHLDPAWLEGGFAGLVQAHFEALAAHRPELVLLGTGSRQRFPRPRLYASLMAARIGLEVMDLGAACRTYNILAAEGRRVAAALILEE